MHLHNIHIHEVNSKHRHQEHTLTNYLRCNHTYIAQYTHLNKLHIHHKVFIVNNNIHTLLIQHTYI
jgi:hypothetical protein